MLEKLGIPGLIRRQPLLHFAATNAKAVMTKYWSNRDVKHVYKKNKKIFNLNSFESKHLSKLKENGYTILHNYFPKEVIDLID